MTKTCNECGQGFDAKRSDAAYCSGRCRVAAYRKRTGQAYAPRKRRPITDAARDAGWDLRKAIEKVERIVNDDRMPRHREDVSHLLRWHLDYAREALDRIDEKLPGPGTRDRRETGGTPLRGKGRSQ